MGSLPNKTLLHKLKPANWFSAHLHTKFGATIHHLNNCLTRFVALDKCLPHRNWFEVLDITTPTSCPLEFNYDEDWLTITRAYHLHLSFSQGLIQQQQVKIDSQQRHWIQEQLARKGSTIPMHFIQIAPPYEANQPQHRIGQQISHVWNPQTEALLELLDLPYVFDQESPTFAGQVEGVIEFQYRFLGDPNEIILDDENDEEDGAE